MFNKYIIDNFLKVLIERWLKSICKSIDFYDLKLIVNKKYFSKLDEIYLEAKNLIYQDIYINKIIIKIYDCNLKFNYRNHLIYSEDLIINSFLTIDNRNIKNMFFSNKWEKLRKKIENTLTEGKVVSNLVIDNNLIIFNYNINKLSKEINLKLNLRENLIFLENINTKAEVLLPLDKNIKFNRCYIKNELINIDLSSLVIFDS